MDAEILIPQYGGLERLRACLDSLRAQTRPAAVCVIDDGSPDATATEIPRDYPEVRFLAMEANAGFGRALNRGAETSPADTIVLLNNDTRADPRFLEELMTVREASAAAMVAPVLRRPDGSIDSAGIEVTPSLVAFDAMHREPYRPDAGEGPALLAPCAGAGAYDRALFLSAGGFDPGIDMYLEDMELGLRMQLAGGRCAPAPRAFVWHEHSASLGSGSQRKNRTMASSRGYILWKYRNDVRPADRARGALVDAVVSAGQLAIDRNTGGLRGRAAARRASRGKPSPPAHAGWDAVPMISIGLRATLARRLARRS